MKSKYEITVDLIKALIWPLFAFAVLVSFWRPLHSTIDQLPDIVGRSNTISIAGLSLKIDNNLKLSGKEPSLEVKQALSKLTPDDVSVLLGVTGSACYPSDGVARAKVLYAGVLNLGLFEEAPAGDYDSSRDCAYVLKPTDFGREAQTYLYALISEFVQQLNKPIPLSSEVSP